MVSAATRALGKGLYTPDEAAVYARVNTRMMNRWVFGDAQGDPVLTAQIGGRNDKVVTFLDFVQTLAVRVLKINYGVPLQRIREAIVVAQRHGIQYPFAVDHETFLIGSRIGIQIGQERYMELAGRGRDNLLIKEVVEVHKRRLEFGTDGLAQRFTAFHEDELAVVMDPKVRFGEPVVASCGYSALTLWSASKSEGSIRTAADVYGVTIKEVELACSYFDYLQSPNAA